MFNLLSLLWSPSVNPFILDKKKILIQNFIFYLSVQKMQHILSYLIHKDIIFAETDPRAVVKPQSAGEKGTSGFYYDLVQLMKKKKLKHSHLKFI